MNLFGFQITRGGTVTPHRDDAAVSQRKIGRGNARMIMQAAATGRLESSWNPQAETADAMIAKNWRTVAARSRNAAFEDCYGKKFVKIVRTNVVGAKGIGLRSTPRDANGKIDIDAKDAIEAAWKNQSKLGNWDVTGKMSRAMFERLWIGGCAMDGEAIAMFAQGEDASPTGFALQMVDPMRLDPQHNEVLRDGAFIRHGIEHNAFGRPIAYHFLSDDPSLPLWTATYYGRTYQRVPAERVIHAYIPELVGQKRGIPWLSAALWRMNMLKGFEDAAGVNARVGASKMGFLKDPDGEMEAEDMPMNAEPGTIANIGNMAFESFNPTFPDQAIEPFIRAQLRGISSGLGSSYAALSSDLSQSSFSSMREGRLADQDEYKTIQEWMIDTFNRPVYERWMDRCLLAGSIKVKGRPLRLGEPEKYRSAEFKPRRWAWVDPQAEVTAAKMAVDARLASRTRFIEEWGDGDAYDTFEEMANEETDMEDLGVQIMTTPGSGTIQGGNPAATKKS